MRDSLGRLVLWSLVPFLAAWAVYYPALEHEYLNWDDPGYVSKNLNVLAGLTQENILWGLTTGEQANWHPLTWWSLQLDSTFLGPKAESYHFTNILLHAIASGLFLIVATRILGDVSLGLVASLVWAVHPLHVESVAWISERKDVLSVIFWLLATWAYLDYVKKPSVIRMLGVVLLLALGLAAKPMLVTFPFTLLLLDYAPLHRLGSRQAIIRAVVEKVPLFLLVLASSSVTLYVQAKGDAVRNLAERSVFQRLEGAAVGYGFYLKKTVLPTHLAAMYEHPKDRFYWEMILSLALVISLTWGAFQLRRRAPLVLVGWLFFLGTLVPVIGLLQVGRQAYADRYTYIPHLGLFLSLIAGAAALFDAQKWERLGLVVAGCLLTVFAGYSAQEQSALWRGSIPLWERVVELYPDSASSQNQLGVSYLDIGDFSNALPRLEKAIQLDPADAFYSVNRALALKECKRYDEALKEVAEARKRSFIRNLDQAKLCSIEGEISAIRENREQAIVHFRKALEYNPHYAGLHYTIGHQCMFLGRKQEARDAFLRAVEESPASLKSAANLATILLELGQPQEAIPTLETALRLGLVEESMRRHLRPEVLNEMLQHESLVRGLLAECLVASGREEEALTQAHAAMKQDPSIVSSWIYRAFATVAHPDPKFRDSQRPKASLRLAALVLAPDRPPQFLDVQAAFHANQGDFEKAKSLLEEAIPKADPNFAKELRERLALYRAGKPYRLPESAIKP